MSHHKQLWTQCRSQVLSHLATECKFIELKVHSTNRLLLMIRPFSEELARDHASIWILNPTTTRPPPKYTETRLSNLFSSTRVSRFCATLGNPRILSPSGHHGYQDGTSLQTEVGLCFRPSCTMRPKTAILNTSTIPSQIL
jgi:hypothetical protein